MYSKKKIYGTLLVLMVFIIGTTTSIILIGNLNAEPTIDLTPPSPSEPIISGPDSVIIGNNTQYSAVAIDLEGNQLLYIFDFGDGYTWSSDLVQSGLEIDHSHSYTSVGNKWLIVTVQNTLGKENESSKKIEVLAPNTAPNQPNPPSGPNICLSDTDYGFSFSTTDPEGDNIRYEVSWGDGTTNLTLYYSSGTLVTSYHQWADEDTYSIKVRAQDEYGLWSSWSEAKIIEVLAPNTAPNQPNPPSGPNTCLSDTDYGFSFNTIDPEGDDIRYMIDWGDDTTNLTLYYSSGTSVTSYHQWADGGTYFIKVRAQDEYGLWSSWSEAKTIEVIAPNTAPNRPNPPSGPDEGWPNRNYGFSFSTTDPEGDNVRYEVDWGDGTTLTLYYSSGTLVTSYHIWTNKGIYSIKVRAQDEHGLWSSWSNSHFITIDDGPI